MKKTHRHMFLVSHKKTSLLGLTHNCICRMFISVSNLSFGNICSTNEHSMLQCGTLECHLDNRRYTMLHCFFYIFIHSLGLIQIGNCERDILIYPCLISAKFAGDFPLSKVFLGLKCKYCCFFIVIVVLIVLVVL